MVATLLLGQIGPVVKEFITKKNVLIVIDALDVTASLTEETANLMGSLIGWLLHEQRETNKKVQCLVGMPTNLLQYYSRLGGHFPSQDAFVRIEWDKEELEKLIIKRIQKVITKDPEIWLKNTLGLNLSRTHKYTFGRPRDYIKMVRKCLSIRSSSPTISANACWKRGLNNYTAETLSWLQGEWQLALKGFEELIALLQALPETFSEKNLREEIEKIRQGGSHDLATIATNNIISDLCMWKLISETSAKEKKKQFTSHPVVRVKRKFS